jgi:hypothetical protein
MHSNYVTPEKRAYKLANADLIVFRSLMKDRIFEIFRMKLFFKFIADIIQESTPNVLHIACDLYYENE